MSIGSIPILSFHNTLGWCIDEIPLSVLYCEIQGGRTRQNELLYIILHGGQPICSHYKVSSYPFRRWREGGVELFALLKEYHANSHMQRMDDSLNVKHWEDETTHHRGHKNSTVLVNSENQDTPPDSIQLRVTTDKPTDLFIKIIQNQKDIEEEKNVWRESMFYDISILESNNVGRSGEEFMGNLCDKCGIECCIDGIKSKEIGGGAGDGTIKQKTVEIKTARIGNGSSKTFQHELGELPWLADYMAFFDVGIDCIYLTIFKNWSKEDYKTISTTKKKCDPYFPTKTITWRKMSHRDTEDCHDRECCQDFRHWSGYNFKLDTSLAINEANSIKHLTIKITPEISLEQVGVYINKMVL